MIAIRAEIDRVASGEWPHADSPSTTPPTRPRTCWSS